MHARRCLGILVLRVLGMEGSPEPRVGGALEVGQSVWVQLRAEMPVVKKRRVASKTSCIKGACVPPCVVRRCTMRR